MESLLLATLFKTFITLRLFSILSFFSCLVNLGLVDFMGPSSGDLLKGVFFTLSSSFRAFAILSILSFLPEDRSKGNDPDFADLAESGLDVVGSSCGISSSSSARLKILTWKPRELMTISYKK